MNKILLTMLLTTMCLSVRCAETTVKNNPSAGQQTIPIIRYSSTTRVKPESFKDEALARKLLRERDAIVNEMIAERQRLFLQNADIKELWAEVFAKYRRVASYLNQIHAEGDPAAALANHPEMLEVYRSAQKGLSQIAVKLETRKAMLTLTSRLADHDFEIHQLERLKTVPSGTSQTNNNPSTTGSK